MHIFLPKEVALSFLDTVPREEGCSGRSGTVAETRGQPGLRCSPLQVGGVLHARAAQSATWASRACTNGGWELLQACCLSAVLMVSYFLLVNVCCASLAADARNAAFARECLPRCSVRPVLPFSLEESQGHARVRFLRYFSGAVVARLWPTAWKGCPWGVAQSLRAMWEVIMGVP